jgi:isopenicillin N synthase-like dioxygenase
VFSRVHLFIVPFSWPSTRALILQVNVGDMLAHWTGGLLRATPHRVKPPPLGASARISVPFFYEPNFDALIRPLPVMKTLSSSQANARVSMAYASTNSNIRSGNDSSVKYGDHLLNKVTTNFDFNN